MNYRVILAHLMKQAVDQAEKPVARLSDFEKSGGQAGSQPGAFFRHKNSGQDYYIKRPPTEHHTRNELLGAKLYELAGVRVPETSLIHIDTDGLRGNNSVGLMSKIIPNLKSIEGHDPRQIKGVLEEFAVDAWLANWDVVGLGFDNLLHDGKDAVRVDQGGVLSYRAMGDPKGHLFGDQALEIDSLRQPHINRNSAKIFGGMSNKTLHDGIQKVLNIPNDKITETVMRYGPGSETERAELAKKLISRKEHLRQVASELSNKDLLKEGSSRRIFIATALGIGRGD